ncbi:hypothetical protein BN11_750008 [Nostocoides australiense Ben110]|uniref:Uncharacterized protein n=1 Tax=Nostocoides australiense Ben110 TaxID=1193182 RepID=W6K0U3_9MICO|nr:hypothetical protein BN11_750008 [Tetrasphaera australiensis Ben110]
MVIGEDRVAPQQTIEAENPTSFAYSGAAFLPERTPSTSTSPSRGCTSVSATPRSSDPQRPSARSRSGVVDYRSSPTSRAMSR